MSEGESRSRAEDDVQRATLDAIRRARTEGLENPEPLQEGFEPCADAEATKAPRDSRILRQRSSRPWSSATRVDCPECGDAILVDTSSSVLQSTRCEGCGRMLAFDEMVKLRAAEHARASRYR